MTSAFAQITKTIECVKSDYPEPGLKSKLTLYYWQGEKLDSLNWHYNLEHNPNIQNWGEQSYATAQITGDFVSLKWRSGVGNAYHSRKAIVYDNSKNEGKVWFQPEFETMPQEFICL